VEKQSKQNSVCKYCNYIAYISMAFGVSHITAPSAASVSYRQWPGHKKELHGIVWLGNVAVCTMKTNKGIKRIHVATVS
jgi:hypothetical protein